MRDITDLRALLNYSTSVMVHGLQQLARTRGITLLELMLVVAIVSMLGAIAIPSYQNYADRARNNQALSDIGSMSLQIQQWELNNGRLPVNLGEAGLAARFDPWGQPYRYLDLSPPGAIGAARKDKALNPVNTDFDLYSVGKDGETAAPFPAKAAQDDLVRAANGGFMGLAKDF